MSEQQGNKIKKTIDIEVGENTLHFDIDDAGFNKYLNEQMPNDKVKSAFNMLSRGVIDEDKAAFKKLSLAEDGITPKGVVVMQIAMLVAAEFGGDLEISVKKQ